MRNRPDLSKLGRIGERICLDFVNTSGWREAKEPREWLVDYQGLVEWGVTEGVLLSELGDALLEKAKVLPDQAKAAYKEAIDLREAIYRIFLAALAKEEVSLSDLALLNKWLQKASEYEALTVTREGDFTFVLKKQAELESILWHIAKSAGELLTSSELERVKRCEGDQCGWLFLDTSRNRSRRWCSMEDCGNRAKARRHYERERGKIQS